MVTEDGLAVEVCFVPARQHDARALGQRLWDFAPGDQIYEDHAYSCYEFEDLAQEAGITILSARRSTSARERINPMWPT
jgi:hypothetical protein